MQRSVGTRAPVRGGLERHEERVRRPWGRSLLRVLRTIAITLGGVVVLIAGLVMLVTPGPGVATCLAGIAVLATRYAWAGRLLTRLRGWGRRAIPRGR